MSWNEEKPIKHSSQQLGGHQKVFRDEIKLRETVNIPYLNFLKNFTNNSVDQKMGLTDKITCISIKFQILNLYLKN